MISRLFGLLRESIIAGSFGAGILLDSFLVANRIPNMLRELVAEGALGASFTKVFSQLCEIDQQRARRLWRDSFAFFLLLMLGICLVGMLFSEQIVGLLTLMSRSQSAESLAHHASGLTVVLFPFIAFMTVGALAQGALHQQARFLTSSLSPIAFSAGCITGALLLSQWARLLLPESLDSTFANRGMIGLAIGFLLGGFLQSSWQLAAIWSSVIRPALREPWQLSLSRDLRQVLSLMTPMIIAASAGQVNVLVNTNFATSLDSGAVSWLTFAFRMVQLPVGLIAVAVASTVLPRFSRILSVPDESAWTRLSHELYNALNLLFWLTMPCLCGLTLYSESIIQLIFGHGAFDQAAVQQTADVLYYYSFALVGFGLMKVFTSLYYAIDRTKYAMKVSLLSILTNIVANAYLVNRMGAKGLALSTSIVLLANGLLLIWGLRGSKLNIQWHRWSHTLIPLISATGLASLVTYFGKAWMAKHIFANLSLSPKGLALCHLLAGGLMIGLIFGVFGWQQVSSRRKQQISS